MLFLSEKLVYVGAGLGVTVLSVAVALLIFLTHRSSGLNIFSGLKHTDTETVNFQNVISAVKIIWQ